MKRILTALLMVCVGSQVVCADIWDDLAKFKWSESNDIPPVKVEKIINETPAAEQGMIEDKLLAVIESKDSTQEAKMFACRMLQRVGSDKCVPALEKLLCVDIMSHYARLALENMKDSDKAGAALRNALGKAPDNLKGGIASSLGERRDSEAVKQIAKLAESKCGATAKSALIALGKIADKKALKALQKAKVCDAVQSDLQDALLSCAIEVKDVDVLTKMYENSKCSTHRAVALGGALVADEGKGSALLVEAIKGDDAYLRDSALSFVVTTGGSKTTAVIADALGNMSVKNQAAVLGVIGDRGDTSAATAVAKYMSAKDAVVSDAAIAAAGLLGDASTVNAMLALSADKSKQVLKSLSTMTDAGVNGALIAALKDDKGKQTAAEALSVRKATEAIPALKKLLSDSSSDVRKTAWSALGVIGGKDDLSDLMSIVLESKDDKDVKYAKACMKEICGKSIDKEGCVKILGGYYEKTDTVTKKFILDMAAVAGSKNGLDYARSALKSGDKDLYMAAVRAMAAWSKPFPSKDLMELSQNAEDPTARILALRGCIQMITLEGDRNKQLENLNAIKPLVQRVEEKRLLLSAAGECAHPKSIGFIAEFINDADVKIEARGALIQATKRHKKSSSKERTEALNVIINDKSSPKKMVADAKRALNNWK